MRQRSFRKFTGIVVFLFSIVPLGAEGFQIAPFYGVRFGGLLKETTTGDSIRLDTSGAAGATINIPLPNQLDNIELLYSHQETDFSAGAFAPEVDARVDVWQAGILHEYPMDQMRPFLVGTLGASHYSFSDSLVDKTLFSVGLGGGVKYFPTEHVGLRLDARAYVSFVDGSGAIACSGGCTVHFQGSTFFQGEIAPSIVVLF